ncbi:MAG: hypothetical protein JXD18_01860 [Anaerolineae bacterium]|nr:hypothetical protein [Anaerolineae bacterium]
MPSRLIAFANSSVSIEFQGQRATRIVDFLWQYTPADSATVPVAHYRLLAEGADDALSLYRGTELLRQSASEASIANLLMGDVCYNLAYHSTGGLLFHAGGVSWQGQGIILPGTMGAGKTTLTAWLLTRGFDYLTDEMVYVPDGASHVSGIARPLNVKSTARSALRQHVDYASRPDHVYTAAGSDLISPALFRSDRTVLTPPLTLIIFPRYQARGGLTLAPLSKAQTGLALMECLVNARNLPNYGMIEIARLAKAAPAYTLTYGGFGQLSNQIERLLTPDTSTGRTPS